MQLFTEPLEILACPFPTIGPNSQEAKQRASPQLGRSCHMATLGVPAAPFPLCLPSLASLVTILYSPLAPPGGRGVGRLPTPDKGCFWGSQASLPIHKGLSREDSPTHPLLVPSRPQQRAEEGRKITRGAAATPRPATGPIRSCSLSLPPLPTWPWRVAFPRDSCSTAHLPPCSWAPGRDCPADSGTGRSSGAGT